jgi:hypothetical protein
MENPAYKLWRIGYKCRSCPLYLPKDKLIEMGWEKEVQGGVES